ncbi:MAG: 1-deoxy-D-xylulose-5-phosphate reductoisomerase [Smithellaceae bacterium]|nr:1-deoxy-D-xylulose-5-phosphate reductoisomerase [Syntrophaceae bacterium]MDD4240452.1 1-deoxy-D-xylulose-5-phosphate reductoisomerase [Smithellaceae bacterium]NLX50822.1 1-deoxy-D-xylulose-5-phosphate reductoisomerase [Deltaproteobacteria bacterium]
MKKITILGSTGSIGQSALDVIAGHPEKFGVAALVAGRNVRLLARQITTFRPSVVAVRSKKEADGLLRLLGTKNRVSVLYDESGVLEAAAYDGADMVVSAISGAAGLRPTLAAMDAGKNIALANKETLVAAGPVVMKKARQKKIALLPVDSEHSAIFQCLAGQKKENLKRIILTASGGPFLNVSRAELKNVTPAQALRHPRWKMGPKITIDSASLMNKGLEVIEAQWLFGLDVDRIDVLIHPQSAVHSLIELVDGSMLAQLGIADMRIPIACALSYPDRMENSLPGLDLAQAGPLDFAHPNLKKFPCLRLAYEAARLGGTAPAALNAANEEAVGAFLENKICFTDLPKVIEKVLNRHAVKPNPSLEDILRVDGQSRAQAQSVLRTLKKG